MTRFRHRVRAQYTIAASAAACDRFFGCVPHCSAENLIHHLQLHQPVRQQRQGPARACARRSGTRQLHQLRFACAIELVALRPLGVAALQQCLQPFFYRLLAPIFRAAGGLTVLHVRGIAQAPVCMLEKGNDLAFPKSVISSCKTFSFLIGENSTFKSAYFLRGLPTF